jgi:heptaprenyl diphosphate synthase
MIKLDSWSQFLAPVRAELDAVEGLLQEALDTEVSMLAQAGRGLFRAGGKRLRPAFLLLAGKLIHDDVNPLLPFAAAVEIAHTATLVHDDLVDDSPLRRGRPTVKAEYGNRMAVYTGNYLFNQALGMVTRQGIGDDLRLLVAASVEICQGEIEQFHQAYQIPRSLRAYLRRIQKKTALLMALSCQLGGVISHASAGQTQALRLYGRHLGMAFQISDDVLDFIGTPEMIGKPVGSDVTGGMITLPALYALAHSSQRETLARLVTDPELCRRYTDDVIRIVVQSGGVQYAQAVAERYGRRAAVSLRQFPDSPSKQALLTAARRIAYRRH